MYMRNFLQVISVIALLFACHGSWASKSKVTDTVEGTNVLDGYMVEVFCEGKLYDVLQLEGEINYKDEYMVLNNENGSPFKLHIHRQDNGWATGFGLLTTDSYIATIHYVDTFNNNAGVDFGDLTRSSRQKINFVSKGGGRNIYLDYTLLWVITPDGQWRIRRELGSAYCTP